jgi:hypothetical protein
MTENKRLPANDPVELRQAFSWTCPRCSRENFVKAEVVEFEDEEERREALVELGMIEHWEPTPTEVKGEFVQAPDVVRCSGCRVRFPAVETDQDGDAG